MPNDLRPVLSQANNRLWRGRIQESINNEGGGIASIIEGLYTRKQTQDGDSVADRIQRARDFNGSGLPRRHMSRDTSGDAPEGWVKAGAKLLDKTGSGFLFALLGPRGTGKTQLAVRLARISAKAGRGVDYAKTIEIFLTIRACFRDDASDYTELDAIARFIQPDLLIIDEIQERGETAWEDRMLTYIIDKRYDMMRDTLIIGNIQPTAFRESLGPSIFDRLIETGGVIQCDWPSFRQGDKP